ncbi:2,3-bisphosphoglycerate-independent phosphoglycerate mutase [Hathewaya massiliensis]|uniref:2,3-bisphosphoglycerate-independent phosphoglycerate mutase n=1 Tax=Hathewaya massiliensis TaxID=1964382 RepID=UPI00115843BF|nr:2,3-bisphosphoglycerate-independent phosphoglycerate mutase [Hathewaya massiliensis]
MERKPVMLMILDGFGISQDKESNAAALAKKPNFDKLMSSYPSTLLSASGLSVGLPEGQMGNSEVGHLNIGAGRIIFQHLTGITRDIENGEFFKKEVFNDAIDKAINSNNAIHLIGLLSDGGVHSHIEHLKGLLKLAKLKNAKKVYVHAILDGRDVPPKSAEIYIKEIEDYMKEIGIGKIATISGRYYSMDRDKRWERVELSYRAMVQGRGEIAKSAFEALDNSYHDNKTDEFVLPTVIIDGEEPTGKIENHDTVIFFNFRPDRAREITRAINDKEFEGFKRETLELNYVCMTEYDKTIENVKVAYPPSAHKNTLGEYVSNNGKTQLRIAETEKYAHVTFFFSGGREEPYKGEERILVSSPKVATYDLQPEMSAPEVTDKVVKAIEDNAYDMIILNYANPDMVGHTGVLEAAIKAVETVDTCLGRVVPKILEKNGTVFITADHGNCEQMIDYSTGKPLTSHTTNKVPFLWVSNEVNGRGLKEGVLADIAPTMLETMGLSKPEEMTGNSLIKA